MNTIDTIVRELERIPEPMQLSVLDFILFIGSNNAGTTPIGDVNQKPPSSGKRRTTSIRIAGKGRTLADIVSPIDRIGNV